MCEMLSVSPSGYDDWKNRKPSKRFIENKKLTIGIKEIFNEKWVSDITYIWTDEGWLYLSCIMDLYSRKLIGLSLSERMTSKLVIDALKTALWSRDMPKNVILHSDRGSQYCSTA